MAASALAQTSGGPRQTSSDSVRLMTGYGKGGERGQRSTLIADHATGIDHHTNQRTVSLLISILPLDLELAKRYLATLSETVFPVATDEAWNPGIVICRCAIVAEIV